MTDAVAQMKDAARQTWAAGDYDHAWEVVGLASMGEDRADIIELEERLNRADDGSMDVVGEYLIVMARKS